VSVSSERQERGVVNGVLLLDKPAGMTSQGTVTRVKAIFRAAKAGHTGTLDPMATGLLPLTFGEATKFSQTLLDADKAYLATVRLGVTTATGDLEGQTLTRSEVSVSPANVDEAVARFRGEIVQIPPMYSALKHAGRPLYQYARAGVDIPRQPRHVTIHALTVEHYEGAEVRIAVRCSKGTYIRVLAQDIGNVLGCGATLAGLRRTAVGPFAVEHAVSLESLTTMSSEQRSQHMLPVDALLSALPSLTLDAEETRRMVCGQVVSLSRPATGLLRVYGPASGFLGVAEASAEGRLVARRLLSHNGVKA
jgi:tRNA pseudouridine55 synthase